MTTVSISDITNKKNLLLLIQLRWLAMLGQVVTIITVQWALDVDLPLVPMGSVILFLGALNLVSLGVVRRREDVSNGVLFVELLLDVAALTVQLYLSGGASNPFTSLYLLQVILGAVLLEAWSTWALVVITSACFVGLTVSNREIVLPNRDVGDLFDLHVQGAFICFVLAATLLVLFITRINRNLRARDAYLADLRQRSVEEDHIVRIGLLASGAAHELGTPLATLSVILNDWRHMPVIKGDPEIGPELEEMQNQLDRCKKIVSGILMSSGEARGEGTVRTTVRRFFDQLVEEWRASRSPARLEYATAPELDDPIVSDAALKQVIFNVLDNALEASPGWVAVSVTREGEDLWLTVRDAGPGFREDMLAEFGKPYRSTKNRPGGGLGLFLVVNVVRKLGGTVRVQNLGGGACVTLALPLASLTPRGANGPTGDSDRDG